MARQLVLGADVGDSQNEAIILNVGRKTFSGCTRNKFLNGQLKDIPRYRSPQSRVYSLAQVESHRRSFAAWQDAVGEKPLGTMNIHSNQMQGVLGRLTDKMAELMEIDRILEEYDIRTPLFHAARKRTNAYGTLVNEDMQLTEDGRRLLEDVDHACKYYARLPELLGFGTDNRRQLDVCLPSAVFSQFMQASPKNPLELNAPVDWVAYELKPLHIRGVSWKGDPARGARTESIDHLLEVERQPVLAEVKMRGDCGGRATSKALHQILYYASTMANAVQRKRLCREFPKSRFAEDARQWIALLIEERKGKPFQADRDDVLKYVQHQDVKQRLGGWFAGIFLINISTNDDKSWRSVASCQYKIEWK